MEDSAVSALAKGQVMLFGGVLGCVVLLPGGLSANNGISYYGVHLLTVPVLAVALLSAAGYTRRGLRLLAPVTPGPDFLRRSADAFAVLLVGILLTPYTVGMVMDWTHRGIGSALFVLQLVLGARLVGWTRDAVAAAFWGVQLLGGVASAVYVLRAQGYELETQTLFQLGFGALVLRAAYLLTANPAEVESAG
jgi:lipid-A-disaccharide synthase-like uncharacterized protein